MSQWCIRSSCWSTAKLISAHNFRPLLMTSPEIQWKLLEALAERLAPATT